MSGVRLRKKSRTPSSSMPPLTSWITLLSVSIASFFAGTLLSLHSGIGNCESTSSSSFHEQQFHKLQGEQDTNVLHEQVETLAQQRLLELKSSLPDCKQPNPSLRANNNNENSSNNNSGMLAFPTTTKKYAVGMARTSKEEFTNLLDLGVPIDLPQDGDSDVLVMYSREAALPSTYQSTVSSQSSVDGAIPQMNAIQAMEHCEYVNIILTDHSKSRNQCIAIVPQYESYHIQKWMRVETKNKRDGTYGKLNPNEPLRRVSRGMQANGLNQFAPPSITSHVKQNWNLLRTFMDSYDASLNDLKGVLDSMMKDKSSTTPVIVMVCNFGQSELLVNFVCAAKSRNLDLSTVLLFATDEETKQLAEHLGITAFYDQRNFGEMPAEAAKRYGDSKFTAMMMAKVICVQMVSALNYDLLFQDVDIVWYKHPMDYFKENKNNDADDFDIYFQDDGGHSIRYAPYSANSGFYFVRNNPRTQYFLTALLQSGDLILKTDSHQQALIALLSEHVSLYGLRAKVWSRDSDDFPGGYHYHQNSGKFMHALFAGKKDPYIFHMSWTLNKDNKLLFLRQMGEWYVQDQCVHKKVTEINGFEQDVVIHGGVPSETTVQSFSLACCAAEALFSCHYRDKPSKVPCNDSPNIDEGRKPFW